jgi:hypothetical protein
MNPLYSLTECIGTSEELYKSLFNSFNPNNITTDTDEYKLPLDSNIDAISIDLSDDFTYNENKLGKFNKGISSSFAITSIIEYYNEYTHILPYDLAREQYLKTHSWTSIDVLTGLEIMAMNKIITYQAVNLNSKNIKSLLTNRKPVICSIKVLPYMFSQDNLKDEMYWRTAGQYYKYNINFKNNDVYAISSVIVGYDSDLKMCKLITCLKDEIKYFYVPYDAIDNYQELFFHTYIIHPNNHLLTADNLCVAILNKIDNINIISTESNNSLYSSQVSIESFGEFDYCYEFIG